MSWTPIVDNATTGPNNIELTLEPAQSGTPAQYTATKDENSTTFEATDWEAAKSAAINWAGGLS